MNLISSPDATGKPLGWWSFPRKFAKLPYDVVEVESGICDDVF